MDWKKAVDLASNAPASKGADKAAWSTWIKAHEARTRATFDGAGAKPPDPGKPPSELAAATYKSGGNTHKVGSPPAGVWRTVTQYHVTTPDGKKFTYHDHVLPPGHKYLVHPTGVRKPGTNIAGTPGVDQLFRKAGITDPSVIKVIKAVSTHEGGFAAVNTYDAGHVSAGFIQFTSGKQGKGSLTALLRQTKSLDPRDFATRFAAAGVDVDNKGLKVVDPKSGTVTRGAEAVRLIIADKRLTTVFHKAGLESKAFRVAQVKLAKQIYYLADKGFKVSTLVNGQRVTISGKYGDVLRSEAGKVAIMDRAVQYGPGAARTIFKREVVALIKNGARTVEDLQKHERQIASKLQNRHPVLKDKSLSQPPDPKHVATPKGTPHKAVPHKSMGQRSIPAQVPPSSKPSKVPSIRPTMDQPWTPPSNGKPPTQLPPAHRPAQPAGTPKQQPTTRTIPHR